MLDSMTDRAGDQIKLGYRLEDLDKDTENGGGGRLNFKAVPEN